ncbi:phage tail tape measure protein [Flavobacterium alkalisoli]|uniref:Phage tail tape measure protein n=1 Tax=Flavobacterium alkalisoli TaxID=2602769 RepID=A0A5B9FVK9_9FLAO|nr:phage tail tape measure protein [Flavobacterium alkalisoli]QEE51050.1 phage tail tape measure protein [Flavobacterium alkalisoli]
MPSKLELLMELKNKLFNTKLKQVQEKLGKATDYMKGKLRSLKEYTVRSFKAMTEQMPLFGRAVELLGNPYVLLASGIVAVTGLLATGVNEAGKFNAEFLNIRQLNLDKTQEQLTNYKTLIRDSAFETGKAATDTAKAYYDIQSALGYYGKDAKEIFTQVANFSTATGADLNDSINATTKAIKAFGLGVGDTRMLLESNARAVQVGITTFKELAQVQTEYAGAAKGAGQNVDVANKIFAGFTSIAKGSAEAANMTKTAFQGLTQEATIKGLKSIGVSLYDNKGQVRDLTKVLEEVNTKFQRMTPKQIDELINKIGGPEGLRALFVKLKTGADDFFNTFNAFDASSFNLDDALKNAKGDFKTLSTIVKNKFNTVMIGLGEKILPSVAHGLEFLEKLLDKVYRNMDTIIVVVKRAALAFAVFKTTNLLVASSVGKVAMAFTGGLSNGIKAATTAMKGFNTAFKSNMVGLIASMIATLAVSISDLKFQSEEFQKFLEKEKTFDEKRAGLVKGTKLDLTKSTLASIDKRQAEELKSTAQGRIQEIDNSVSTLKATLKAGENQNAKNINSLYRQLKEEQKNPNQSFPEVQKRIKKLKFDIDQNIREITGGYTSDDLTSMRKKNEQILSNLSGRKLVADDERGSSGSSMASEQVNSVSERASQPRSITINIEALNKGGINTSKTTLANKTPEEIEEWFNEAMMRVLRGVELSYE